MATLTVYVDKILKGMKAGDFQCSSPFVSSFSSGRWLVYGTELPSIPEVGAVAGKPHVNSGIRARAMYLRCYDNSRWLG
jgi:hypothetical protein